MEYNDEKMLSISEYEAFAKAYSENLKAKGFRIVNLNARLSEEQVSSIFQKLFYIKSLLFNLGGFLNTSAFYSLNERQLKKFSIIFDFDRTLTQPIKTRDKTKCFLEFLSTECMLVKELYSAAEESSFEKEIKDMTNQRLSLLSSILAL
ncbi:MAG: hypothetical protein J6A28_01930 [Clostridia bacterium]|nr:hypothetical protein [Clostridia bacterium]